MKYDYVNRFVSSNFKKLGWCIGKHPLLFVFIPLIVIAILSSGFSRLVTMKDSEYLYCPVNGRARQEREVVETLFPLDENDFDMNRMMRFGRMAILMMEAKDGGSMLRENIIAEIRKLNEIIENISIIYDNQTLKYDDLCLKNFKGKCNENFILSLSGKIERIKSKKFSIKFPFHINEASYIPIFTIENFGGVTSDRSGYITDIKAMRLMYFLKYIPEEFNKISLKWEEEFLDAVSHMNPQHLHIYKFVGSTSDSEYHKITQLILPYLLMIAPLMAVFAIITSMTGDWVTSKPWIGVSGCLCPILGGISAFGILLLCGAKYIDLNIMVLFLLLGVGLDDCFVLLSAWRRTNIDDSVEKRMSEAYSEAAVSITITSFTNFLSFGIGMTTPYKIVQIFSLYSSSSILFAYIVEITLFGGIMALSGIREKNRIHPFLCTKVNIKKTYTNKVYKAIKVGLISNDENLNRSDIFVRFYRDVLGKLITKPIAKLFVVVSFIIYISGGIFCLQYLKQGFDYRNGFPYSSYAVDFTSKHYEYFVQYPHAIQLIIKETLDYSDPKVQKDVTDIVNKFATAPNMAGVDVVDSWLKYYLLSFNNSKFWLSYRGYNMSNSEDFVEGLQNIFLKFPSSRRYEKDIMFNDNRTQILASRFIVASKSIYDSNMERDLLTTLWNSADSSKYKVYVHNYWFLILNQLINIKETSTQTLCIVSVMMTVIFLVFIPNLICAICVALAVISIQIGIMGYMSIWGVSLDTISMLILIMTTGLSVDYAAHISYAYVTSKNKNPNEKVKNALESAGHPIFQGCVSTILGVAVLGCGPSYSYVIMFKIVTLAMSFSFFHGIFLLPVLLNIWETISIFICKKVSKNKKIENDIEDMGQ